MPDYQKYDYVLVIDKSGSEAAKDCPGGISRWEQSKAWAKAIAQKCEMYDSDGIDVIVFDSDVKGYTGVTSAKVDEIFRTNHPGGSTNLADALKMALQPFLDRRIEGRSGFLGLGGSKTTIQLDKYVKPRIIIVITDGEPNDYHAVEDVIIKATESIAGRHEVGITFVQVGSDLSARDFLKVLDDKLPSKGAKFDIVDTKDYSEMSNCSIEDVFEGALTD